MTAARSDPPALATADLSRRFGCESAVDGVNLAVRPGNICALVGLNGAGKTTLMRMLLGMLRPDGGSVTVLGRTVPDLAGETWARVGHLLDGGFGYPELTVRENLRCAGWLRGMSDARARVAVEAGVADLRLGRWADRRTRTLSTGNRQRLGLACAMLGEPKLLVLDEPTTALDPSGVVLVRSLLRAATDHGAAVLLSSHHLDEMARVADRILVMHRGRIVGQLPATGTDLERSFFDMVLTVDEAHERSVPQ